MNSGIKHKSGVQPLIIIAMSVLLTACVSPPIAQQPGQVAFIRTAYATIGAGLSRLDPDASLSTRTVNDGDSEGGQLAAGIDLNRWFSVELHAADLGSAGLSPGGQISYQMYGASGLVYAGKNRSRFKRQGLTGYGRLGVSAMNNSATASVPYRNDNRTSLLVGAGLEYAARNGVGFRGEVISFDEDAVLGQIGIIYRFGDNNTAAAIAVATAASAATITPPVPALAVIHPTDQCADTALNAIEDTAGCITFGGVSKAVNFHTNSEALTQSAKVALNEIADTLLEHESASVILSAHTDSRGSENYNLALSERRANSVANYLSQRGVPASLVKPIAFGETQPVATNETVAGRMQNRRVEIFADK